MVVESKLEQEFQKSPEAQEAIYNFPEIAGLKPGMITLVQKLRENIDQGKYDCLVSDDVGGRIPTLVLRNIIKERLPSSEIDTKFVASGARYRPDSVNDPTNYAKLQDYLREITKGKEHVLAVTQYVHSGGTMFSFVNAIRKSGVPHVDAAVLNSVRDQDSLERDFMGADEVFLGSQDGSTIEFNERNTELAGVAKTKEYNPKLDLLKDVIAQEGRGKFISQEEWREIFDIKQNERPQDIRAKIQDPEKNARWEARAAEPLSEEELAAMRDTIVKAREDVKTLSKEVLKAVWS